MPDTLYPDRTSLPLWPLPLIAGLLPLIAAVAALWISVLQGYVTACNPLLEGCISISRAGRQGLANHVFRALMLPAATLQAVSWLLTARWLTDLGAGGRSLKWLAWMGVCAGIFLVLYATFLGTEGEAYRWLRRYGVIVYFGFTYLSMLIAAGQLHRIAATVPARVPARLDLLMLGMLAVILLMGLFNYLVRPMFADEAARNRIENILEWFSGLGFTLFFFALAWLWRRHRFGARLQVRR